MFYRSLTRLAYKDTVSRLFREVPRTVKPFDPYKTASKLSSKAGPPNKDEGITSPKPIEQNSNPIRPSDLRPKMADKPDSQNTTDGNASIQEQDPHFHQRMSKVIKELEEQHPEFQRTFKVLRQALDESSNPNGSNHRNDYRKVSNGTKKVSEITDAEPYKLVGEGIRFKSIKSPLDEQFYKDRKAYYEYFAERRGMTPTEYEQALHEKARKLVTDKTRVCMRIPSSTLEYMLRTNSSIKNMFETMTSSGTFDIEARQNSEKQLGNYDKNTDPRLRIIYGFLYENDQVENSYTNALLEQFGDSTLVYEKEIRRRTSFTVGDAFPYTVGSCLYAKSVPVERPNGDCFPFGITEKDILDIEDINDLFPYLYLDAQIHYGHVHPKRNVEAVYIKEEANSQLINLWIEAGFKKGASKDPKLIKLYKDKKSG